MPFSGNQASVNTEVFSFPAVLSVRAAMEVFQLRFSFFFSRRDGLANSMQSSSAGSKKQ